MAMTGGAGDAVGTGDSYAYIYGEPFGAGDGKGYEAESCGKGDSIVA